MAYYAAYPPSLLLSDKDQEGGIILDIELIILPPHDYWEENVPEPIRKQFPLCTDALDHLEKHPESREAAISLFWKIYGLREKQLLETLDTEVEDRVDELARKLGEELREGLRTRNKDRDKFFVYHHVTASLLTILEKEEQPHSERVKEVINESDQLWNIAYSEEFPDMDTDDPFERSHCAIIALLNRWEFNLDYDEGKWEEALHDLAAGIAISRNAPLSTTDGVDPQKPVNAFEKLWDISQVEPDKVESWANLADYCEELTYDETIMETGVEWKGQKTDGFQFWTFAKGLCMNKLSLGQYEKLKQKEERQASEVRLRNYFFDDCWDDIPEAIREEELIPMDDLWFRSRETGFGVILERLQTATELLLKQILWDPFMQRRGSIHIDDIKVLKEETKFNERLEALQKAKHTPGVSDFVAMLKLPSFKIFLEQVSFPEGKRDFVLGLTRPLNELKSKRNKKVHPKEAKTWSREEVAPLLREFLGIGCPGILPQLARMLRRDK